MLQLFDRYMISDLSPEEVRDIYTHRMVHDFPRNELKPLRMINQMRDRDKFPGEEQHRKGGFQGNSEGAENQGAEEEG